MKNIKNIICLLCVVSLFITSCDEDQNTGESTLTPSKPTITLSGFETSYLFAEKDSTIVIIATLSEAQIVDVFVDIFQSGGEATEGEDYVTKGRIVIPASALTGSSSITIMSDDVTEDTETLEITIGGDNTSNASITPVKIEFTIPNVTSGDLVLTLGWSTASVFDASGAELAATDVADLILSVYDGDVFLAAADGASFEELILESTDDDITYSVYASIYAAADLGGLGNLPLANLIFGYAQSGIQSGSFTFGGALDLTNVCDANRYHMADVVKTGSSYEIIQVGKLPDLVPTTLVGTYTGQDSNLDGIGFVGESQIVAVLNTAGDDIEMTGINVDFMENVWGEAVQTSVPVKLTIDYAAKTIVIEEQFIFTTLYDGALYDYTIYGTGYVDACNNVILEYEMNQDGFLVGGWLNANGYSSDALFTAIISL
ncbi:MAG: hypothetical protein ACJA08_001625 [Cyclobacteriaceae bacterium]|jgi:hypothetical protein